MPKTTETKYEYIDTKMPIIWLFDTIFCKHTLDDIHQFNELTTAISMIHRAFEVWNEMPLIARVGKLISE